jgi:uncharacterized phage protein (TIGR02218 family)
VSRSLSLAQQQALDDSATQLCTLWLITRADDVELRLADYDVPVDADGQTWLPNGSTERSAIGLGDGLRADNLDISGILEADQITAADLLSGRYDYAAIVVSVGFANLALPSIPIVAGRFGEVTEDNGQYKVQVNDLAQALQASIGESTSAACRADFGDARCQASLATWRDTYTLASVTDARTLVLTGPAQITAPATYANGLLEVMDGPAAGLQMEVRSWTSGTLTLGLYLPLPIAPEAGDTVRVTTGCDKSLATCRDTFANSINFQGEPHVPGIDSLAAPEVQP